MPDMLFFASVIAVLIVLLALCFYMLKKTSLKLKFSERLLTSFMDAGSDLVYLKDENFKYVKTSKSLAAFYKKTPEEMTGLDDYQLAAPEIADALRNTDKRALENMAVTEEIVEVGGHTSISIKFPVLLPNGKYGVGAHIRDITKERAQEKIQSKLLQRAGILIQTAASSFKNQEEQLDYVLQKALELTESKNGYIYSYDENSCEFTLCSWSNGTAKDCEIQKPAKTYKLEQTGLWGEVVRQRRHIVANSFDETNTLKSGYPDEYIELTRFMSIPLMLDGKIAAVVGVANKEDEYDYHDVMNLIELMGGAWQMIQRKAIQSQLAFERNKYRQTLISIGDGVMITDWNGNIEMLNKVAEELTGWSNEDAVGRNYKEVFRLSHEDPSQTLADPIESVLDTHSVHELDNHALLTSRCGRVFCLEDSAAPIFNEEGSCVGVVLVFRDVTVKKEQRKKIEYLSYHDQLTGLYNRSFFEEEIKRLDTERNLPISILMGDLNGLKLTNDIFGHAYGDELLKKLAGVFTNICRADDIIARWGGDEFVLLLPKTAQKDAESIARRIKDEFSSKQVKAIKGSVSIGIASKINTVQSIQNVLDEAEEYMYSVKTLEREAVTDEEVLSIINLLHKNHPRENEHSIRMQDLCGKVGEALGLSGIDLRNLKEAAYYHDIGKVILSPEILNAERELSSEELAEVKKHPVVGYRILNSSDRTVGLAEAVLAHHEQWLGQGYPKGLKGVEIPLLARIIAVAERYDRLNSIFTGEGEAMNIYVTELLKSEAGKFFDPHIVDVLLNKVLGYNIG